MASRHDIRPVPVAAAAFVGLALFVAATVTLIPLGPVGSGIHEGDRAPRALDAAHDAQYESVVQTDAVRAEAARRVPDQYFPPDPQLAKQQSDRLKTFLDSMRALRQRTDLTPSQQLAEAQNLAGSNSTLTAPTLLTILTFTSSSFDDFVARATTGVQAIMDTAVQPGKVDQRVTDYLTGNRPDSNQQGALRDVLRAFVLENVKVDAAATKAKRDDARAAVPPVIVTYTRGQVIAAEGKVLDASDIEALRETGVLQDGWDRPKLLAGVIAAAAVGLISGFYVAQMRLPPPPGKRVAVVAIALVAALAVARGVLPSFLPDRDSHFFTYGLPLVAPALIAAAVAGLPLATFVAAISGLLVAFVAATYPDLPGAGFTGSLDSLQLAAATAVGGLGGAIAVGRGDRWYRFLGAALVVSGAVAAVLLLGWLLDEPRRNAQLPWLAGAAAANGAASALIAAIVSALVARSFGTASVSRLLRLAQPSAPLLQRLLNEAPGTYHHSVAVATLAERAASRIGADALLARVGAYYHDIGKLEHPRYFVENMIDGAGSPHDALPPAESARIIREHVTGGLRIAEASRLPAAVRDFIPQHHGTRLVTFFYRRAGQSGEPVDPAPFRYDGPRPQTRETAIVMLADSCEAAVRAAQATGGSIDTLVDEIVGERLAEGQLDDCDLTMRDVREVAASIKETLRAMYHPRIPYPDPLPEEIARLASAR